MLTLQRIDYYQLEKLHQQQTLPSNNEMPFALNLTSAVDDITDFEIPANVKLDRRARTKLEEELYNCVPQDL